MGSLPDSVLLSEIIVINTAGSKTVVNLHLNREIQTPVYEAVIAELASRGR